MPLVLVSEEIDEIVSEKALVRLYTSLKLGVVIRRFAPVRLKKRNYSGNL